MNIEDVIAAIDETYRRTGGRMPVRLICGRKLFQTLCDEAKIEYDVGNVMTAKFYGIPITVVHNTELIEDDKIIVVPENWNGAGQTTGTTGYCYDWVESTAILGARSILSATLESGVSNKVSRNSNERYHG